jgi:hypothetical protein
MAFAFPSPSARRAGCRRDGSGRAGSHEPHRRLYNGGANFPSAAVPRIQSATPTDHPVISADPTAWANSIASLQQIVQPDLNNTQMLTFPQ